MKTLLKSVSLILASVVLFSCQLESFKTPEIPPAETMVVNFDEFNVTKSAMSDQVVTKINWIYSAATVVTWSSLLGVTLAVPVTSFKSVIGRQPTKIDDNTWEWNYNVEGFTGQYTAKLVGIKVSNQINWEMYVTKTGASPFQNFLWIKGTSDVNNTKGQWILNHSPAYPGEVMQIDWKKSKSEVGEVKYTYVRTKQDNGSIDSFFGSYMHYGIQDNSLDAFLNIHAYVPAKVGYTDTEIQWSRKNYNGRIKSEYFYKDLNWHCWDAQGNDVNCN
jgi:hypothetical protein